jgi:hypothetical protein
MLNPGGPPQQPPAGAAGGLLGGGLLQQPQPPPPPLLLQPPHHQPPTVAPGFIPIVGHSDFLSRYQDASLDPYQGVYDGLMNVFDVPVQGQAIAPAGLMTQVADSTIAGVPSAFLMLVEDPTDPMQIGKIMCFHRVTKFPARLGSPSQWDHQVFAFSGNNVGPQITTVHWRNEYFGQVNGGALLRVPTEQQADIEAAIAPTPTALGPYQNVDAGTETVKTRRTMIVPPAYIRLFLSGPLPPVLAYQRFRATTTADGTTAALLPLSVWLRAAMTRGAANSPSPVQGPGPMAPLADANLHRFTWSSLTCDIPALDPGAQANHGLQAVAGNLGMLVQGQREARLDAVRAREASVAPKAVETLFRTRLEKLMRYCRVNCPEELPAVYSNLANCRSKDMVQTMQDAVELAAEDLHLGQLLVITPALAKKIINVAWAMVSVDDLESGIHHFHVVQQSPEGMAAARHLVNTFDLLHTDGTSLSLEDAERLASIQTTAIPLTWIQARHTIGNLVVLCHVFLGAAHPLTIGLSTQFTTMVSREVHLEHMAPPTASSVPRHLLPCYFIRWNQIRFARWFSKQQVSLSPVPAPQFDQLLDDIDDRLNWLPDFPHHLLPAVFVPAGPAPSPRPISTPTPATPAPALLPTPAPAALPTSSNRRVDNVAYKDAIFGRFKALPGCTMQALRARWSAASPPLEMPQTVNGSRRRCLPYHVKGICNDMCRLRADHVTASDDDDQVLLAFCTAHWHL